MNITPKSISDYVSKRCSLLNSLAGTNEHLTRELEDVEDFSFGSLFKMGGLYQENILHYFLLKELKGNSEHFDFQGRKAKGRAEVNRTKLYELYLSDARSEEIVPLLGFFNSVYEAMQGEKIAWLMGEGAISSSDYDIEEIIEAEKVPGLERASMSDSPRPNWDRETYRVFRSESIGPVAGFCRRFPTHFKEAIFTAENGGLTLSLEKWKEKICYNIRGRISDSSEKLIEIARIADEYL